MVSDGNSALQPVSILSPRSHPPTQECRCEFPTAEVGARSQSELGCHRVLTSLPPPAVVFPQDLLEKGLEADNFAMLGLGDIVIPGDRAGGGGSPWVKEERCETGSLTQGEGERGFHIPAPGSAQGLVKESTSTHMIGHQSCARPQAGHGGAAVSNSVHRASGLVNRHYSKTTKIGLRQTEIHFKNKFHDSLERT